MTLGQLVNNNQSINQSMRKQQLNCKLKNHNYYPIDYWLANLIWEKGKPFDIILWYLVIKLVI